MPIAEQRALEPNCKFAVLALHNVRVDTPPFVILPDGTRVLKDFPFLLDDYWKDWLGTIQFKRLEACNLFLVRTATNGWQEGHLEVSGGEIDQKLQHDVGSLFAMLRLLGTIEYESAFMLAGYVQNARPTCRHFATTERFDITRGCLPWVIREKDLCAAVKLYRSYAVLLAKFPERWRLGRGCHTLKVALEQYYASDRLHGFVRALEALILPDPGATEKQFVSRCVLFAGPKSADADIRAALREAYKMRCDVEHVHDWDRSLQAHPLAERENVALWRTRQMEELACSAYRRILSDADIQPHFYNDVTIKDFWNKPDDEVRAIFDQACDISRLKIVNKYNSGRAHPSEWPSELFDDLRPKAKAANEELRA